MLNSVDIFILLAFSYLLVEKISCSAELSMKKGFITTGPDASFCGIWFGSVLFAQVYLSEYLGKYGNKLHELFILCVLVYYMININTWEDASKKEG